MPDLDVSGLVSVGDASNQGALAREGPRRLGRVGQDQERYSDVTGRVLVHEGTIDIDRFVRIH